MKAQFRKRLLVIAFLVVLIMTGLCYSCSHNKETNVGIQSTDSLSSAEISKMKENAVSFYQAAYAKDFDIMKSFMTENYSADFERTQESGSDEGRNDGTERLLNLSEQTVVEIPKEVESPVSSSGNIDYSVKLILSETQSAYVCFSKTGDEYKVSLFDLETRTDIDIEERGGYMGSGYQEK